MSIQGKIILSALVGVFVFLLLPVDNANALCDCYCKRKSNGQQFQLPSQKDEATCKKLCTVQDDFVKCQSKGVIEGMSCGTNAAYSGSSYKAVEGKYGSGVKCASGLACTASACDISNKEVGYSCEKSGFSGMSSQNITDCKNGTYKKSQQQNPNKPNNDRTYKKTTADALSECKQAAPTERGIFTRGLSDLCLGCGECSQCDVFQVIANITSFIFSIAGGLAVFFLVNTGFTFVLSRGNQDGLESAKKSLTTVIIGIIIVLGSWAIINTVMSGWIKYKRSKIGDWFYPTFECNKSTSGSSGGSSSGSSSSGSSSSGSGGVGTTGN